MRNSTTNPVTELQRAEKDVVAAEAALAKAQAAVDAERGRIQRARDDLAAVQARIDATDPSDVKALMKLDGERTGLRVALEVLERARLSRAESAAQEAEAALASARTEADALARAAALERLTAEAARIEGDLVQRARAFRAEVEPVLSALAEARRGIRDLGEPWEGKRWPDAGDSDWAFFSMVGFAIAPPAPPTAMELQMTAKEAAEQAANRRNDEQFLRSLTRRESEPVARDSGLTETQLAILRGAPKPPRPRAEESWRDKQRGP